MLASNREWVAGMEGGDEPGLPAAEPEAMPGATGAIDSLDDFDADATFDDLGDPDSFEDPDSGDASDAASTQAADGDSPGPLEEGFADDSSAAPTEADLTSSGLTDDDLAEVDFGDAEFDIDLGDGLDDESSEEKS